MKRISLSGLLHDAFHFVTHLEKGFGYTLKQLATAPGTMQRRYIEGARGRHQKPFSMFILCATIDAVSRYWIFGLLLKYSHSVSVSEAAFVHSYLVLLYAGLMPVIALLTWSFFRNSSYNYAEMGVLQLYTFSFFFVVAAAICLLKLIWPPLDTACVELPVFLIYNAVTFIRFFEAANPWRTLFKSVVLMLVIFFAAQKFEDVLVRAVAGYR